MAAAPITRKIRHELAPELEAIWTKRRGGGEFSLAQIEADIAHLLKAKDLNNYCEEMAKALALLEDHSRSTASLPDQLDLFTENEAAQLVLPLNGGRRVFLVDATWPHLRIKQSNQIKQVTLAQNATQRFSDFMDTVAEYMQTRPRATVRDAMKRLGKW